ncbi:EscU/YscU/HrcU family type III secretion system export apparatus switch protein [Pseudoprimorskyibacter insulae]|uniref:Flagellar biosynthetic protein FlhB n=1 Tax=Pseudoprimorskyibacter insulae TaxID=1695997 RepID=A0A2R8AYV3_9RHOB|nr:flagellar type III secretion system protein FlhB [Pseudoprimorskyibacter insulae]SPF81221.1 Flagellar biosynthetic protein FlhB [Pseudoprimorskyibacter insulae]
MSQQQGGDEDKPHEASQKKLDDARKKGEIPRSADLGTAVAYFGLLIGLSVFGAKGVMGAGGAMMGLLSRAGTIHLTQSGPAMVGAGKAVLPWVLIPGALVLASLLVQRSFTFHLPKLAPKMSRISIISNAKNKFGRTGLFEFAKSFFKLLIYALCLGVFIQINMNRMLATLQMEARLVTMTLAHMCLEFLGLVCVVALIFGVIDVFWQRAEHQRRNRMSQKEMRDEHKESEGDPMMKQKRRQKAMEIAMNSMLADVPDADVVIVNPTHYAVALKWDRGSGGAPICMAKGVDEIAAKIREIAAESGVPIQSDPPTARALHASLEVGDMVDPIHYAPVAAAIRFAEDMRLRAKRRR